jgi:hypothetical protein
MLSSVVNSRPQPRRFSPFLFGRPTLPILEPSPLALSHSLDALCSKSVHQPFSNQSLPHSFLKMPGCRGLLPLDKRFNVQTFGCADVQTIPGSIPFILKFLRTLLRFFALSKNSSPFFSGDSALFSKNHPGWGTPTSLQEGKMKLPTADSSDPTVRNGRPHQAVRLEMIEGERPRKSSSLIRSVGVAGGRAELYISGQSEGPATIPGNSSREKKK